jgi:3-oxoacyl-[acyl-carrier protein] reductase
MALNGRVALVTGASRGIGRAIALRLARDGAAVALNYRSSRAQAEAAVEEIRAAGGRALAVKADVGEPGAAAELVEAVERELGAPDILVNNAAIIHRGDLEALDPAALEAMWRVNVAGLSALTRQAARRMKQRRWGRIINLTSIAAHGTSLPGTTFYAATKAAVITLTRRFAMELGPHGITVNAIAPGFILTDMVAEERTPEEVEALKASMAERAMVRRIGRPEDIAAVAAFLAGEESGFLTAQTITVDGGRMDYIGRS